MKSLMESLLDDGLVEKTDKMIKDEIKAFLNENYNGSIKISQKPNAEGKYEVSSTTDIEVKNPNITSLTDGSFVWNEVKESFSCSDCTSLKSLEGAPKKVGGDFYCSRCPSLNSLKDAPKKVGGDFICYCCKSLKSLEYAPKEVNGDFNCIDCSSLKSLNDAPEKVGRKFDCSGCDSLK